MTQFRIEHDSMGDVKVPADKLWGAQTQRSLTYFSIGQELIPKEMIRAYATLKKACALANLELGHLSEAKQQLICNVCDEITDHQHDAMFPLHVWMTGSGTQFNMNVNEVISNRCSQIAGEALGSKRPVHPNDDVNMSQSTNDNFPSAMYIAAAIGIQATLLPAASALHLAVKEKAVAWKDIVKIGRTHMQDATPLTLGQEFSGYAALIKDCISRLEHAVNGVFRLTLGGTAVGTGINAPQGFAEAVVKHIATITKLPFVPATNKFALQGSHDDLVQLSATMKTLAVALHKIANDIRLLSCGPRAGLAELKLPANEPGSSIMPGKVNPTQCEALTMLTMQVMANDLAVTMAGGGGALEMNAYKPLLIHNVMQSIRLLADGMVNFRKYLVEGLQADEKRIAEYVQNSLMLVTALSPVIGYDKAAEVAHYAMEKNISLREAVLETKTISEEEFNSIVDPRKMTMPNKE